MLTHTRLWRDCKTDDMPDVSHMLPKMRETFIYHKADIHISLSAKYGFANSYDPWTRA